jgi:alkanesulfonate monooxygenase SsuD/methylene tetrahydromethanopterin reductase-like flavin-dependent oxidoreductase (luciferase family)
VEQPIGDAAGSAAGRPPFEFSIWTDMRSGPGGPDPARRFAELRAEVQLADRLGYGAFWSSEQHAVDDGYLGAQLTLLAGVASLTSRLRLMPSAIVLPFHPLRHLVEQALVVDLLSGGRLALCVAGGGYEREFRLFDVDMRRRAEIMERALPMLRQGLSELRMPDGPDGGLLPVTPAPVQARIPILLGGLAGPVADRAARLADGLVIFAHADAEERVPALWHERIEPALRRHGRSVDGFHLSVGLVVWTTDDPERDWATMLGPAFEYQQRRYDEWKGAPDPAGVRPAVDRMLVDTPDELARRLMALRAAVPFAEIGLWYRLPGVPHADAMAHLERLSTVVSKLWGHRGPG